MGQYYKIINISKRQMLHPHKFGDGLKLMEFGCSGNGTLLGLTILMADGNGRGGGDFHIEDEAEGTNPVVGSWAGDRIVFSGDYADEGKFIDQSMIDFCLGKYDAMTPEEKEEAGDPRSKGVNLYQLAGNFFEDISDKVLATLQAGNEGRGACSERRYSETLSSVKPRPEPDDDDKFCKTLTPDQAESALCWASRNGERYFDGFRAWLRAKKLRAETKKLVREYKFPKNRNLQAVGGFRRKSVDTITIRLP